MKNTQDEDKKIMDLLFLVVAVAVIVIGVFTVVKTKDYPEQHLTIGETR